MSDNNYLQKTEFLLFQSQDGEDEARIQVAVKDETIWLTQKGMAELFGCSSDNISLHLKNIYESGELLFSATAEEISVVQKVLLELLYKTPYFAPKSPFCLLRRKIMNLFLLHGVQGSRLRESVY